MNARKRASREYWDSIKELKEIRKQKRLDKAAQATQTSSVTKNGNPATAQSMMPSGSREQPEWPKSKGGSRDGNWSPKGNGKNREP